MKGGFKRKTIFGGLKMIDSFGCYGSVWCVIVWYVNLILFIILFMCVVRYLDEAK